MNCILKFFQLLHLIHIPQFDREQIFVWWSVFIAFGIYIILNKYYYLSFGIVPLLFFKERIRIISAILLGIISGVLNLEMNKIRMINSTYDATKLSGTVLDIDHINNGIRFLISTNLGNIRVNWKGDYDSDLIIPGNQVSFLAKVFPISYKKSPFAFNFRRYAYFKKIVGGAVVLRTPKVIKKGSDLRTYFKDVRNNINNRLFNSFDENTANIAAALITGNKSGINSSIRGFFTHSGIAHILAISGLHVSLVGGFVFLLIRIILCLIPSIALKYNTKKIAAVFSFLSALFYVLMATGGIPATRAIIMHAIIVIAVLMDKNPFSMRNVSIAATVILLFSPDVIYSPGFYMSFFAVIALIHFYEKHFSTSKNYFINIINSSVIASSAVIPFSIYFFNNLTINSIPANLIAIPLTAIVIMPALLCFSVGLETIAAPFVDYGINFLITTAKFFSSWKYSYILVATPPDVSIQIMSLSMLLIFLSNLNRAGTMGILISLALYYTSPSPVFFISKNTDIFGLRKDNKIYVNNLTKDRGVSDSWMVTSGLTRKNKLKDLSSKYQLNNLTIYNTEENVTINGVAISKDTIRQHHGCIIFDNGSVIFTEPDLGLPWLSIDEDSE